MFWHTGLRTDTSIGGVHTLVENFQRASCRRCDAMRRGPTWQLKLIAISRQPERPPQTEESRMFCYLSFLTPQTKEKQRGGNL